MASRPLQERRPAPLPSLRLGLLPLAIAGCVAIAFLVFQLQFRGMLLPMIGLAGGCLGVLVVIRPAIGLAALIVCAAAVRLKIGTGTDSPIVASLLTACLLLAGWSAHQMLHHRRMNLLPRIVAVPGMLLVGFTLFSLIWGRLNLDPRVIYPPGFIRVQLAAAALTLVSVGLLFVGADLLRDRNTRTILTSAIIVIGFVALPFRALGMGVPVLNSAGLFGLWFVALCWGNALANGKLPSGLRYLLAAGAIGWLLMAFLREGSWVSGWLPALIALLSVTLMTRPRLGLALALVSIVGIAFWYSILYDMLVTQQEHDGSLGGEFGRLELWKRNLSVIEDHLLFGTGPAGYALYYVTFLPTHAMSTHSNFIDVLAQSGVFALTSLIALLAGLWQFGLRTFRRLSDAADRALCGAVVGAAPAVAFSLWLGDWLIPFVYNQTIAGFDHSVYSWLMFATISGLHAQQEGIPADA